MSKHQSTLRTERKRQNRAKQTERYHRLAFIAEYTQIKYGNIYQEAERFYDKLHKQYPTKTKITTSPEFKIWQAEITKGQNPEKQTASTANSTRTTIELRSATTPLTPTDQSSTDDIQLNIQLMNAVDVEETRNTLIFEDIYPTLVEEMNTEIFNEIVSEIQEADPDIFNDIINEDMNDMIEDEINISLSRLDSLEKELLKY